MDKSRREDSGPYVITAENAYGKDSADVEVRVHFVATVCIFIEIIC